MLKNVQIIEKSSGHMVAEYPILDDLDDISYEEHCEEAWELAVEEGLVENENRDNYDIEIVGDTVS